jgi:hypothetical protein
MYGEERCILGAGGGKPEAKTPLGDPDIDGRIIFKWIFMK